MAAATSGLGALARAAFVLLAALLPFELVAPLTRVGPLVLTSVEIPLCFALAVGAAAIAADGLAAAVARGRLRFPRLTAREWAIAAFALVMLASAVRAPLLPGTAFKFALRSIGGMAVFVVSSRVLRPRGAVLAVAGSLAAGAIVAALLVVLERHVPGTAEALSPFHAAFDVFGLPRASGPFQYPNIAAMYLEAAGPVVLATGAALDARRGAGRGFAVAAAAGALLVGRAVSLTESRAGLLTVAVVLAGMAALAGRARRVLRRQALGALAGLALLGAAGAVGSLSTLRLKFWQDEVWYRSTIAPAPGGGGVPASLAADDEVTIPVEVRNLGARPWPAAGAQRVQLSYHWREVTTDRTVVFDGVRTPLPRDLPHGAAVRLDALVRAPARPGRYRLELDLVHEGVTWFSQRGNPGYAAVADVLPPGDRPAARADVVRESESAAAAAAAASAAADAPGLPRGRLWRGAFTAFLDHPLLGLGPDNFRHALGRYVGVGDTAAVDDRLHANNWFLETLATLGLAGAAALAFVVVMLWRTGRQAVARHAPSSPEGLLAFGLGAALAAYAVHGLLDYFLEFTPTYAMLWLLAGMLAALADSPMDGANEPG